MTESGTTAVRVEICPPVGNTALNGLFSAALSTHRRADFRPRFKRSLLWVAAYRGDRLVGFTNVIGDGGVRAFLLDTTVHPEARRQGIGVQLVRCAGEEARLRGARRLHVDHVPELTGFYARCGFTPTAAGILQLE